MTSPKEERLCSRLIELKGSLDRYFFAKFARQSVPGRRSKVQAMETSLLAAHHGTTQNILSNINGSSILSNLTDWLRKKLCTMEFDGSMYRLLAQCIMGRIPERVKPFVPYIWLLMALRKLPNRGVRKDVSAVFGPCMHKAFMEAMPSIVWPGLFLTLQSKEMDKETSLSPCYPLKDDVVLWHEIWGCDLMQNGFLSNGW